MNWNLLRNSIALVVVALCTSAHAGLFRAYLSGSGSDSNPCTLTLPCRLLPAALTAVNDGGEIWMLDSANFNTSNVDVTKSVSILAIPGQVGSILSFGGPAISVSTPTVKLALRNLGFVPFTGAVNPQGIQMSNGDSLSVDNCVFAGLSYVALYVLTPATARIANSVFRDSGSAIVLAGGAKAEIVGTQIDGATSYGVQVASGVAAVTSTASMTDSTIANVQNCGVFSIIGDPGAFTKAFLTRVTLRGNNAAVCVQGGANALATLTGSTIQGNVYGAYFSTAASVIRVFGNNALSDNVNDTFGGSLTTTALR